MNFQQLLASLSIRSETHLAELVNTGKLSAYQRESLAIWYDVPQLLLAHPATRMAADAFRRFLADDDTLEGVPA